MTKTLFGAMAAVALALSAAACVPEPPPPTTPPAFPAVVVGCHDGNGSDVYFNGPMNTADNAVIHATSNGTCGNGVAPRTLVQASSKAGAEALCAPFGPLRVSLYPLDDPYFGYTTLHSVWEC